LSHSRRSLSKASSLRFLLSSGDEPLPVAAMRISNEDWSPVESTTETRVRLRMLRIVRPLTVRNLIDFCI
jgi:hypothetical protein